MRSLHPDLLAAQVDASREPYVAVTVRNDIGVVRRLDFAQLDASAWPDAKHDAGLTADGALHRARMEAGTVQYQRVTNPTVGPWGTWTALAAGMGSNIAVAAWGQRVIVIYSDAGGTNVRYRESTDSGATFSADALLFASPFAVADLAVAYTNTAGDMAVAWCTSGTVNTYLRIRTGGALGGQLTWPHAAATLNGIALVRGLFWEIVLTGEEITTLKPTVWSLHYDPATPAWSALWVQAQADVGISAFGAPSLTFSDTWRVNYVEAQLFTGGATRLYKTWVHPFAGFDAGAYTWRTPIPIDYAGTNGLAHCHDGTFTTGYVYESGIDRVRRAATASVALDLTPDILAIDIDEQPYAMRGTIDLDNASGAYAGPQSPITLGARVNVSPGYITATGARTSPLPDMWIAAYEHIRAGGLSVLRLQLEGGWGLLRRSTQRTAIAHTADTYSTILNRIAARAGFDYINSGASARLSTVTPAFAIDPATSGYAALRQAYAFLEDRPRFIDDGTIENKAYSAAEASIYTYGADHPLRAIELRAVPAPVSEAHAFGAAAFGDDLDFAQLAQGVGEIARQRDLTSTTGAAADATAAAHRRTRQLDADHGSLTAPPNVGLQLYDVIKFSDPLISAANIIRRVTGIRWRYDKRAARYEHEVRLTNR